MLTPKTAAAELRRIAAKIDASSQPDRTLVARDIRRVLSAIAQEQEQQMAYGQQQQQGQQEQTALPLSGVGKKILEDAMSELQKAVESGDQPAFKRALEKLNKAGGTRG